MRTAGMLILVGMMAGCFSRSKQVTGPDGKRDWYSITCRSSRAHCLEEAGDVCPGGYEVADASEKQSFELSRNFSGQAVAGERYDGQMLVKCKTGSPP